MKQLQRHIPLAAFIIIAYVMLPVCNSDYLYTIQDNSIFIQGVTFMQDTVNHHGGWVTWIACYLTQFFYHPWLGSSIIIALWTVMYALTCWLFALHGWKRSFALALPAALMLNIIDYGYWIYYAKTPGFAFCPTLLVFVAVIIACVLRASLIWAKMKNARSTALAACLALIGITASTFVGQWNLNNHTCSIRTTLFDSNFRHEMSMYRALDELRFEDAVKESESYGEQPTNLMVMYKNIALMHTGRLTEMFKNTNIGIRPNTQSSPKVRTSRLGAPLIYYMYGQFNFSYRWAMENAVQYGLSFSSVKMMARCAIMNGERDVAAKYLAILGTSIFHHDWALEHKEMLMNSTALVQSKEFACLEPLMGVVPESIDSDDGLCEKYLLDVFSRPEQTTAATEDIALCMSLWSNDFYAFCVHFHDYVERHPNDDIPLLYQQGAILLGNLPESPITLTGFEFDPIVADKYNMFVRDYNTLKEQGADDITAKEKLRASYGDTYWWYYYFNHEIDFY